MGDKPIGTRARIPAVIERDGTAHLRHAESVAPDAWFWECSHCDCAFGPLVARDVAEQGADAHDARWHPRGV